jgi:hypothetical protein
MNRLWNPDSKARSLISSGNRKETIGRLKRAKEIKKDFCPYCGNPCYLTTEPGKFLTLGGSAHECVAMKAKKASTRS